MHRKLKISNLKSQPVLSEAEGISNRMAGLTLSEVVVASALLIIAIVPMLKALTTANLNTADIERKTHSLILAQAKLDEIKAKSVYHYDNSYTESSMPFDPPDELYLRNVTDVPDGSDPNNLRKVTVSVGYDHNSDSNLTPDEIEVTLSTLIARRWTD
jgi:Tfp pilus assembly protein PilV